MNIYQRQYFNHLFFNTPIKYPKFKSTQVSGGRKRLKDTVTINSTTRLVDRSIGISSQSSGVYRSNNRQE